MEEINGGRPAPKLQKPNLLRRLLAFLLTATLCGIVGTLLHLVKPKKQQMHSRDGFMAVALSWILLSLFGAIPYMLTGVLDSYVDAGSLTAIWSAATADRRRPFPTAAARPTPSPTWTETCWSAPLLAFSSIRAAAPCMWTRPYCWNTRW